jgi:hypothetical protein
MVPRVSWVISFDVRLVVVLGQAPNVDVTHRSIVMKKECSLAVQAHEAWSE